LVGYFIFFEIEVVGPVYDFKIEVVKTWQEF